jgi:hypothetical protein
MKYEAIRLAAFTIAIVAAAACSSAAGSADSAAAAGGRCAPVSDSTLVAGGPVFRDCDVDRVARNLTPNVRIAWEPRQDRNQRGTRCYVTEVEFVVGRDGRPEMATAPVVRASEAGMGTAVLQSLPTWRYDPAIKGGDPVRQLVQERRTMATATVAVSSAGGRPAMPPSAPLC